MQYLLDTNTCIDVMRNVPNVVNRMSAVAPGDCVISTITSYELYTGIAKCASPDKEQAKVELFLKTVIELSFDPAAAREAGRIRGLLESQGEIDDSNALSWLDAVETRAVEIGDAIAAELVKRKSADRATVPDRLFLSGLYGHQTGALKFRRQLLNEPSPNPSLPMSLANGDVKGSRVLAEDWFCYVPFDAAHGKGGGCHSATFEADLCTTTRASPQATVKNGLRPRNSYSNVQLQNSLAKEKRSFPCLRIGLLIFPCWRRAATWK